MPTADDSHHHQFLRLFAEHEPAVRTYVRSLVVSRTDAAEVMQEVAVMLWQKFDEFDGGRDFRKWAFGVARYIVLSYRRDRGRDRLVFDDALIEQLATEAALVSESHDLQREALDHCLQKLTTQQRELVLSAYGSKVNIGLLAEERGQTPMSLYKVLHRIRQALLDCVQREISKLEST